MSEKEPPLNNELKPSEHATNSPIEKVAEKTIVQKQSPQEQKNWADAVMREVSAPKKESLEKIERGEKSFTPRQKKVWSELKRALENGKILALEDILNKNNVFYPEEKEILFDEFSLLETAVNAAIKAINGGETAFYASKYYNFKEYVLPHIENDPDFQDAVLKKTVEYLGNNALFEAYSIVKQFISKETVVKENLPLLMRQSFVRTLENEPFSLEYFKIALSCFNDFISYEARFEPDMQQAAKKAISHLSKQRADKSTWSDILELKEMFRIE